MASYVALAWRAGLVILLTSSAATRGEKAGRHGVEHTSGVMKTAM